jgi:cell division septal protein FtsQ
VTERHVRSSGRQIYGRAQPLKRPVRRGAKRPKMSPLQGRALVIVILILVAGWGIGQIFAIRTVSVNSPARGAEIEAEAHKLLDSNWRWGNLLTFDAGAFTAKLQAQDPILRNTVVKRRWFHTIVVTATLKQPSLGWSSGNQIYVLDRDGTVIGTGSGALTFPVVYDGSNIPVQVGQQVVSAHFVDFTTAVVPALATAGIGVTRLDIKDTTLDLAASTNKGYRLLFDTGRGADDEIADL